MRPEKELLLNEIKEKIESSKAMVVTSYSQLAPNLSWNFRDQLGKTKGLFEVVRKRVFLKATQQMGIAMDASLFKGHIGVLFVQTEDALPAAKALFKFSEENQQILEVICGQIEGKIYSGADVKELAHLPGIDQMRAELIALLTSPMTGMLAVLDAVVENASPQSEEKTTKEIE